MAIRYLANGPQGPGYYDSVETSFQDEYGNQSSWTDRFVGAFDPSQTYTKPQTAGQWYFDEATGSWRETQGQTTSYGEYGNETSGIAGYTLSDAYGGIDRDTFLQSFYEPLRAMDPNLIHPDEFLSAGHTQDSYARSLVYAGSDDPNQAGRAVNPLSSSFDILNAFMNQPGLKGGSFDWRSDAGLMDAYNQAGEQAKAQAQYSHDVNTRGVDWTQRLLSTASLFAGGYAMGNMLGGAQGLGSGLGGAYAAEGGAVDMGTGFGGSDLFGMIDKVQAAQSGGAFGELAGQLGFSNVMTNEQALRLLDQYGADALFETGPGQYAAANANAAALMSGGEYGPMSGMDQVADLGTARYENMMGQVAGGPAPAPTSTLDKLKQLYEVGSTVWDFISPIFGGNLGFGGENAGGGGSQGTLAPEGYRTPTDNLDEALFGAKKRFGSNTGLQMPGAGWDTFSTGNPSLWIP